jgi:hypothetical protein
MPSKFFVMDFRKRAKDLKDLVGLGRLDLTKLNVSLKEKAKEFTDELSSRIQDLDVKTFVREKNSPNLDTDTHKTSNIVKFKQLVDPTELREENQEIFEISPVHNPDNLTPPKRLFDIDTMETVMYEDVKSDVKEKGYVAISHVWGDQKKYVPKGVGVMGGVTWTIPLSDPDKIFRVKNAMSNYYGVKYCWFDVLCMPQDKQDEINLEIPFMGDYYAGAKMVLVLTTVDPVISEDFTKWYNLMEDVMENKRNFTQKEIDWLKPFPMVDLLDISKEKWFRRLWTFQEAIMARNLILVCGNGRLIDLFRTAQKLTEMSRQNIATNFLFNESGADILSINISKESQMWRHLDLMGVMRECSKRDCYKPQDKFFGAFGVLGFKDFSVDYDINMEDLNKKIIQYAYSKGDISWLSVGGDIGSGFIQPMYKPFPWIGYEWKENSPEICGIKFEDEIMHINAWPFAEVVCCEKVVYDETKNIRTELFKAFKKWNLDDKDIVKTMYDFVPVPIDEFEVAMIYLDRDNVTKRYQRMIKKMGSDVLNKHLASTNFRTGLSRDINEVTAAKVTTWDGKDIPLKIIGETNVGDRIMLVRMFDSSGRNLGIVVNKYFRRKGVCICEKIEMTEDEAISRFSSQEFPL